MEASFLRLKQAILGNNVADFDALSANLVGATAKDGSTPLLICQADSAGYTLLHWASHVMNPLFIRKCLDFGVPVDCKDRLGKTALHRAMERSQTDPEPLMEAFSDYLTPAVIASQDRMGRTALHVACMKGYERTAAMLIELSMRREEVNTLETSTGSADSFPSAPSTISGHQYTLSSDDSLVVVRDHTGWTALHFASFYNRMNVIRLLLSTLPGPNDTSNSPRASSTTTTTAASSAFVRPGHKSSSPPPAKTGLGSSSGSSHPDHRVSSATSQRSDISSQQPQSDRSSSLKLPSGPSQPAQNASPQSQIRRFPSVDVNAASNDGWTALHAASAQGHIDVLTELLIKGGGDPNAAALHGQTPLHVACLNSHIACVKLLREHDADPKVTDKAGLSCLACASKDIRVILRKTTAVIQTSAENTSVVGMPHNPTAEREVKFAIQARDKWNRRRTQGGDYFDVVVSREVPIESIEAQPPATPTATSTSTVYTPTSTVQITRHIQVSGITSMNVPSPVRGDRQYDSGSTEMDDLSARDGPSVRDSGSDYIVSHSSASPNGSKKSLVHGSESPRLILKSSQVSSTPLLPSKSKTEWADSRIGDGLNTIADEDEDFVIPRARSDIPISRSESQVPNASSLRVATTLAPAKITTAIKDLESGMYILRWRPMQEGIYHVSIKLRGVEIHGSPVMVAISPPGHRAGTSESRRAPSTPNAHLPTASTTTTTSTANSSAPIPTYYEYPEGVVPTSSSVEDATPLRSPSVPIDLISGMRPDLTPKVATPPPTKESSKEKEKREKRERKSQKSSANTSTSTERDRSGTIGSQSPLSVSPSSATSALSGTSGVSSLAVSDQSHARKRSSSATSSKAESTSARGIPSEVRNTNQTSSDPVRSSRSKVHSLASPLPGPIYPTLPEEDGPTSASSTGSRSLYRMTSTFSPMKSISNELVRANGDSSAASKEIADLTSQVADLNRQLAFYAMRVQELETEQMIADRRREENQGDDKKTIAVLSSALQEERASKLCQGCLASPKNAVAVPCLHLTHCNNCIETMSACPSCGGPLKGFITALVETTATNTAVQSK